MEGSMDMREKVEQCYRQLRQSVDFQSQDFRPEAALILGSGLGALADEIETEAVVPYRELEGFPVSTVAGHKGRFVLGWIGGLPVVLMQGREHYYEGKPRPRRPDASHRPDQYVRALASHREKCGGVGDEISVHGYCL